MMKLDLKSSLLRVRSHRCPHISIFNSKPSMGTLPRVVRLWQEGTLHDALVCIMPWIVAFVPPLIFLLPILYGLLTANTYVVVYIITSRFPSWHRSPQYRWKALWSASDSIKYPSFSRKMAVRRSSNATKRPNVLPKCLPSQHLFKVQEVTPTFPATTLSSFERTVALWTWSSSVAFKKSTLASYQRLVTQGN